MNIILNKDIMKELKKIKNLYGADAVCRAIDMLMEACDNEIPLFDFNCMYVLELEKMYSIIEGLNHNQVDSKIEKMQLKEIAEMLKKGMKQKEIAEKLNVAESTITKRKKIIMNEFNYLL